MLIGMGASCNGLKFSCRVVLLMFDDLYPENLLTHLCGFGHG